MRSVNTSIIHIGPASAPEPLPLLVKEYARELRELGFREEGWFAPEELPHCRSVTWADRTGVVRCGMVVMRGKVMCGLNAGFADRTHAVYYARPSPPRVNPSPWRRVVVMPGASLHELYDRCLDDVFARGPKRYTWDDDLRLSEREWARGSARRSVHGLSIPELKRLVDPRKADSFEERGVLHRLRTEYTAKRRNALRHAVLMEAVRQKAITPEDAQILRHHVEVVHEFTTAEMAATFIRLRLRMPEFVTSETGSGHRVFKRMNASLSTTQRFARVVRLHHPLVADLYIAPLVDTAPAALAPPPRVDVVQMSPEPSHWSLPRPALS